MSRWLAVMLCGLPMLACSPGSPAAESETVNPAPAQSASSVSGGPSRAPARTGPASTWTDIAEARRRARAYTGPKCFGEKPTLLGTPGPDQIHATHRDDVIITLGGDDLVVGPVGGRWAEKFCTGPGRDKVVHNWGPPGVDAKIRLGSGDDRATVLGRYGVRVVAGAGADTVVLRRGSWGEVAPGPGDDVIRGPATRGLFRTTCIDLRTAPGPVRVDLVRGRATGEGLDVFENARCAYGGRFNDVLRGTSRDDWLDGAGGSDLLLAGAGNDEATGGFSTFSATGFNQLTDRGDRVYLGPGDDTGEGDLGPDRVYGGAGSDEITGAEGGDYLDGGVGDDYLYGGLGCLNGWESDRWANLEMLTESWRRIAPGRWHRIPNAGNELFGRDGDDFLAGDRGNDRMDGGPGYDSGTGGYYDGRIDWISSTERPDNCDHRPIRPY